MLPKLRSSHHILALLAAAWLALFVYHEWVVPLRAAWRCLWAAVPDATNVLLVADPQLVDNHTYPGRHELLLLLLRHTVDVYLKQNYRALVGHLQPDYIVFLGDYLDNGRLCEHAYYEREFARFEGIFARWPAYARGARWLTNVPGNHDIGFGDGVKPALRARFASHFGAPNAVSTLGGVEFVALDTPSYLASDAAINADSRAFVAALPEPTVPRVLLSHVPLWRDTAKLPCGPLRERAPFHTNAGYQYQLALAADVLAELLAKVRPLLVFSGDDHDYCDVHHAGAVREVTVKSVSMAMGIRYPAVQLLSFAPKGRHLDYDTHLCYLPTPYVDVAAYVAMAVFSGLTLLAWNYSQRSGRYNYSILPSAWNAEHTTAVLADGLVSQKVSNFLKEQDADLAPVVLLPKYTFAADPLWAARHWRQTRLRVHRFLRRWNLLSFFRHAAILGTTAVLLYTLVVWPI